MNKFSKFDIDISCDKIDLDIFFNKIKKNNSGGIVFFIGDIKKINNGLEVSKIYYEIFDSLAYLLLSKKCNYLSKKYNCYIYIYQYKGFLLVGEINIIIFISSDSRKVSFGLCKFLLEYIKKEVPIWKKEYYVDGSFNWINSF